MGSMTSIYRTEIENLKKALEDGDITTVIAIADSYADNDDPDCQELCELAVDIVSSKQWDVVIFSGLVFLSLLELKGKK